MMKRVSIAAPAWAWVVIAALFIALAIGTAATAAKVADLTEMHREFIQQTARERVIAAQSAENISTDISTLTGEATLKTADMASGDWEQIPLGTLRITHYCSCAACCGEYSDGVTASGTVCAEGRTVACDFLPFGTLVNIGGHIYTVEDHIGDGSGDHIDIYVADHDRALNAGTYTTECYVVTFGGEE